MAALLFNFDGETVATTPVGLVNLSSFHTVTGSGGVSNSRALKPVIAGALTMADLPVSSNFEITWDWAVNKHGTAHYFGPGVYAGADGTATLNTGAMAFTFFGDGGNGDTYFEMKRYEGNGNFSAGLLRATVGAKAFAGDIMHFKVTVLAGQITLKYWKNAETEPNGNGQPGQTGPVALSLPAGAVNPGYMMLRGSNERAELDNLSFENLTTAAAATALSLASPGGCIELIESANFTVLLDPTNSTLAGNVVVTPNDNSGGGTFNPTSVTLTPTVKRATFKYTAASAGTKNISLINNSTLTNPAAKSIVAAAIQPATAISLSGSATGPVNQESQTFRVTANGPLLTPVTVTPTGTNLTFVPTTVSLSGNFPEATFKVVAAIAQTTNITLTNNGSLTNPAAFAYESAIAIVKFIGVGEDFASVNDFASAYANFDCAANKQAVIGYVDENMTLANVTLRTANSTAEYKMFLRPSPTKGHQELDKTGAADYGTLGIQLTLPAENALRIHPGAEVQGFRMNITGFRALKTNSDRMQGMTPVLSGNKILANANSALSHEPYGYATFVDNILIRDQANGGPVIDARGPTSVHQNTFVLRGAGTAEAAVKNGWGGGSFLANNVFFGFGASAVGDAAGWFSQNNYANAATTFTAGMIIDSTNPFFVNANSDLRPGSALTGKGQARMQSLNDVRGNNRGSAPDVGAVQGVPALAIPVPTITSQTFTDGTLTINGTYTNTATGSVLVISPVSNSADTAKITTTTSTLNNGTFTATVTNIQRSISAQQIDLRLSNSGGLGPRALGAALINYFLVQATPVTLPNAPLPIYWHPSPSLSESTRKVEHYRNGSIIGTYTEIGDLLGLPNQASNLVKSGDIVRVTPALYHKKIMIQPNIFDGSPTLQNVQILGLNINGVQPQFLHTEDQQLIYSQSPIYMLKCDGLVWDGIDISTAGAYLPKALIYMNEYVGEGIHLKNMRHLGAFRWGENGALAVASSGKLQFTNYQNGLNGGDSFPPPGSGNPLAHGLYISRGTDATVPHIYRGCYFHDSYKGHLLKTRHNNNIIEGCYFSIGTVAAFTDPNRPVNLRDPNNRVYQSGATCIDNSNGGTLTMRNNIIVHNYTGDDAGVYLLAWGSESRPKDSDDSNPDRKVIDDTRGKLTIVNNTFVAMSDKSTRFTSSNGLQDTLPMALLNFSNFPGGNNPDSPSWELNKHQLDIRDNVYAGFVDTGYREPTALILPITGINLPGIDPGVPFSPKVAVGSSNPVGGSGFPMYAHQAKSSIRTDANKGAVGIAAAITASGAPAIQLASGQNSGRPGYPIQYEWSTDVPGLEGAITVLEVTSNGFKIGYPAGTDKIGVTGYKVSINNGASSVDNGPLLEFTASNLLTNTDYPVQVKAYNATGVESAALTRTVKTGSVATRVTLTGSNFGVIGQAQALTLSTDVGLVGAQTQTVTLSDGAGGVFTPPTLSFSSTVASSTSSWVPAGTPGNRTIAATASGSPLLQSATMNVAVEAAPVTTDPVLRTITVTLRNAAGVPAANLTGIKGAVFDTATPDKFTAPIYKFADGTTNASGTMVITINTVKPTNTIMGLILSNSDGTTTQNPPAKAVCNPVLAV